MAHRRAYSQRKTAINAPAGNVLFDLQCCGDDTAWLKRGASARPPVFKKAVFREYTDETFAQLKPRSPAWEHAGILGPDRKSVV